jgi:hypothetical protein
MNRVVRIILIVCFAIVALVWLFGNGFGPFFIVISIVVAALGIIAFADLWDESERRQTEIREKIADLQKKFTLHTEQTSHLTEKDISSLRVYKIIILSIVATGGLILLAIISIMSMEQLTKLTTAAVTILILLAILLAINKWMNRMFDRAKKIIVKGVVTNKNIGPDEANDKAYHWIFIGERKVKVELALYLTYEIGQVVEFHLFERFGTFILHHERHEGVGIETHAAH